MKAAVTACCLLVAALGGACQAGREGDPVTLSPTGVPASASVTPAESDRTALAGETSPIHDPALIVDHDTWYVFSTGRVQRENGGTIQISSSGDHGLTWAYVGTVWDRIPAWIDKRFADGPLPDNLWAPEIRQHGGTFYLYYSASRFGTDESVTALATNTTLDPTDPDYRWVDRGPVVTSPVTDAVDITLPEIVE